MANVFILRFYILCILNNGGLEGIGGNLDVFPIMKIDKLKDNRVGGLMYRQSLLAFLAVASVLQRIRYPVPNHWQKFLETLQVTSTVAYSKVMITEDDIEKDFKEKQEKIGELKNRSLYSENDVEEICQRREAKGL